MRSLLAGFTTRGTSFLAAGLAAGVAGLALGERDLVSVGALLFILPLLSALAAGRARYRLSCVRQVTPARVPAGHTTRVSVRLENVCRLPIGPLEVRIADSFGLVELGRSFATTSALVVTPKVVTLPRTAIGASWVGEGEGRTRAAAAAGEDDVVPRAYRDGDELRRVHWRSTARYGELMVRREEQRWRNRAVLFLDTRLGGHGGRGPASSFEHAVSAAASIGVHLAREEMDTEFVTDGGKVTAPGSFEDVLLDTLAVIRPSRNSSLGPGLAQLPADTSGLFIVIAGHLTGGQARELAAARRACGPAMALLLAVSTWTTERPGAAAGGETDEASGVLTAAGWRVATVTADTPLTVTWDMLSRGHSARGEPGAASAGAVPGAGGGRPGAGDGGPAADGATTPAGANR